MTSVIYNISHQRVFIKIIEDFKSNSKFEIVCGTNIRKFEKKLGVFNKKRRYFIQRHLQIMIGTRGIIFSYLLQVILFVFHT